MSFEFGVVTAYSTIGYLKADICFMKTIRPKVRVYREQRRTPGDIGKKYHGSARLKFAPAPCKVNLEGSTGEKPI